MPSCPAVIDLMRKYPDCQYIETNTNLEDNDILRKARSIFSDWMRRKEYEPQENLKHIFFAALELQRILSEDQEKVSKSLEEYKSATLQKRLADAIRQIPSDAEASFLNKMNCF